MAAARGGDDVEPGDLDDDLPPLVGEDGQVVDGNDDLPPLVGEDGQELPPEPPAADQHRGPPASAAPAAAPQAADDGAVSDGEEAAPSADGLLEADALRATAALQAAAALEAAKARKEVPEGSEAVSAADAMQGLLAETEERRPRAEAPDEKTVRMVKGISKDDFEECEDAILQGADVNADCGGGMRALHITALRGEMFLTELLIAHGANVNERDLSGNTPLLYTCHFYRQHQRGVQMVAQLLHHGADPFYRVRDGKLAGKSAYDLMEKACQEPNVDESVPRQMKAMLQLAMDGKGEAREAITKVWVSFKSQNKKLYQVSSKKDKYDYVMKNIDWEMPEDAKNAQDYAPVKLQDNAESILEEKFTYLKDYLFTDEGDKVKIYVTFPEAAGAALSDKSALTVDFEFQAVDLKLRSQGESWRLRFDPLHGSIEAAECKHRVSAGSRKVTLTLAKRHKNRTWPAIQKPR